MQIDTGGAAKSICDAIVIALTITESDTTISVMTTKLVISAIHQPQ